MKPAAFGYDRATSAEHAVALLDQHGGDAKVLAGGQSLIPAMNFRLARPTRLVDINAAGDLSYIREADAGALAIGAMTRQRMVERSPLVARAAPLLHEVMPFVAHGQIRNRGTVGGTLAHADPAAELPAVMLALGARIRVGNRQGTRWVDADAFFTGLFTTVLGPTDLVFEVHIPRAAARSGSAFTEVARRHGDYALVGAAAVVSLDAKHRCEAARITLLSVGDGPVLAGAAAATLVGQAASAELFRAAAAAAAERDVDPPGDIHATSEYRRHLVAVLVRRVLGRAFERAAASETT